MGNASEATGNPSSAQTSWTRLILVKNQEKLGPKRTMMPRAMVRRPGQSCKKVHACSIHPQRHPAD